MSGPPTATLQSMSLPGIAGWPSLMSSFHGARSSKKPLARRHCQLPQLPEEETTRLILQPTRLILQPTIIRQRAIRHLWMLTLTLRIKDWIKG